MLLPAVSAWIVTACVIGLPPRHHPLLLLLAASAAAFALLLVALTRHRRHSARLLLAAGLLTASAATVTTVLHTADLHRGPLPHLARLAARPQPAGPRAGPSPTPAEATPAEVTPAEATTTITTVELTVAGDPKSHGDRPEQSLLTVPVIVDRVVPPAGTHHPPTATRTRATVVVRAQDASEWQQLIPSSRLATEVRVLPADPARPEQDIRLLAAHGPPHPLADPTPSQRFAARLRAGLRAACAHLPPDTRGLIPGLVVGDVSRLPEDVSEAFKATDLGHLTAVSGANLVIILSVLIGTPSRAGTAERGGLARLLGLSLRTTALLGAGLTLAFVTVCRPDPSVLRAAATGMIGLLALATGRPRQALPVLSGAVLVLVLLDPYLARSYGFVLSTLATAGLLTLGPRWTAALLRRGWPHHLAGAMAATAAAQAFCSPVTVLLAPRISLVAVPCNLLAELAVAPVTLLGFVALVLEPIHHPAARVFADLAALPTRWLVEVARTGAALPGAELSWPGGPFGAGLVILATVSVCWSAPALFHTRRTRDPLGLHHPTTATATATATTRPRPRLRGRGRGRRARLALAAALLLALSVVLLRPPPLTRIATGWPPSGARLVLCDIGQGDMAVLPLGPDSAVVVDTGPDPRAADDCLKDLGVTRIPLLLLTHLHADHADGLPGVLHGRSVAAVETGAVDGPPGESARVARRLEEARVPVLRATRGERRSAGPQLSWEVLWPDDPLPADAVGVNNASIALLASLGPPDRALRVALLGDLEPPAQAALLRRAPPGTPVDVLKVAHHGSPRQDWELTAALHPRLALISCGPNSYGHPSPRTVDHLRALGATVLRTDHSGDIAVLGDHDAISVATHPHPPRS